MKFKAIGNNQKFKSKWVVLTKNELKYYRNVNSFAGSFDNSKFSLTVDQIQLVKQIQSAEEIDGKIPRTFEQFLFEITYEKENKCIYLKIKRV